MADLSFLKQFTKGDTKKMRRYIDLYLKIAPVAFKKMRQNIIAQDWEQLRINAHSLKPQAEYMGIPTLKALLMQLENKASEGKATTLQALYKEALKHHIQSEASLKKVIRNL